MARKPSATPVLKPEEAPKGKSKAVGKLQFKKMPIDEIEATVKDLIDKAKKAGWNPESGRGTLTLY